MPFNLPPLPYAPDALEPHIDAMTMQVHHSKHHQAYLDKLNKAMEGTDLEQKSIEEILNNLSNYGPVNGPIIRNNGGGYYNHNLFWPMLAPNGGGEPTMEPLVEAINKKFGTFAQFKEELSQAAINRFGSGWAWLCVNAKGELFVCSTPNQDNPIMDVVDEDCKGTPILGLDVWEHAYYLKYQNRRPDYVEAFWNLINWEEVYKLFQAAKR
jgi:Fe-Mn family superoxide dismutase